jgi:Clostridium epsilon toxin ETX/Bacillus mosquitocidal toxin MTX2
MAHGEWILRPNETLNAGEYLTSKNGCFHAVMQEDANFVIYRGDWIRYNGPNPAMWSVWTHASVASGSRPQGGPYHITMQADGNLVLYGGGGRALWAISGFRSVDWGRSRNGSAVLDDYGVLIVSPREDWWDNRVWTSVDNCGDQQRPGARDEVYDFVFDSVEYDLAPGHVKIQQNGPPRESLSEICDNGTAVDQEMEISITWRKSTSTRFSSTTSLRIGATTTVQAGIPMVAKGEVKLSASITQSITWGKTESSSEELEYKRKIVVPPRSKVQGRMVWYESKCYVPFKLIGTAKFRQWSPGPIPISVEGTFDGSNSHDVTVSWSPITDKPELENLRFWGGAETVEA